MPIKKSPIRPRPAAVRGDSVAVFEKLLKKARAVCFYQLRLYITGTTPRSTQAIASIRSLCEECLPGQYDLKVVDIYQQPKEASRKQIIAAPTLVKEFPLPPKRLIGDLSNRDKVILGLELVTVPKKKTKQTKWVKL